MKKTIIIIVSAIVALTLLTGCGGTDFDEENSISVLAREDGSGTKGAFMELIDLKGKPDPKGVILQTGTAAILAGVETNKYAIAYESLGYLTDDVKALEVDGVKASVANIKNGTYKISRPLSVVYQESTLDNKLNKAFFEFLQSTEAQTIINDKGYVSVVENSLSYIKDTSLSGTINISGSTSLQPLMDKLVEKFESLQTGVKVNVTGGGSGTGYNNAKDGVSTFGMISEEFTSSKASNCTHYVVAKDGIAVIVNKSNPLKNITLEDLSKIYDEESPGYKWSEFIK